MPSLCQVVQAKCRLLLLEFLRQARLVHQPCHHVRCLVVSLSLMIIEANYHSPRWPWPPLPSPVPSYIWPWKLPSSATASGHATSAWWSRSPPSSRWLTSKLPNASSGCPSIPTVPTAGWPARVYSQPESWYPGRHGWASRRRVRWSATPAIVRKCTSWCLSGAASWSWRWSLASVFAL